MNDTDICSACDKPCVAVLIDCGPAGPSEALASDCCHADVLVAGVVVEWEREKLKQDEF